MSDDKLLEEIDKRFTYCVDEWREIYAAGDEDMRYVSGDPWPARERAARDKMGRPCLCLDELGQYINQRINDIRQNKRAIKITPEGGGATNKTAEFRSNLIRTIESHGGQFAYATGFECALQRSFGFWAVWKRYVSADSFDMELYIRAIPNPRTVYIDPDAKEPAAKDMRYAFLFQDIPKDTFRKRWPQAEVVDFTPELMSAHPHWIKERTIQVAEYYRIESTPVTLYLCGTEDMPVKIYSDEVEKGAIGNGQIMTLGGPVTILRDRRTSRDQVVQYLTNGVEILERNEWEDYEIPIIPVFGKSYWMETGSGSKRVIESIVRKARDAQMLHNYIKTTEMEMFGQILKSPLIGFEGQFEGHEQEFADANKVPVPFLQVKPAVEATGDKVLPIPQRNIWDPPIQAYEIADESAKRAIQSAMGMYNASVGRQDTAARSGIAIKALDVQSDQGNFHFTDNHDVALERTGGILNRMLKYVYDVEREMALKKPDETVETVTINSPAEDDEYQTDLGEHAVTISTGPSYQSQREEASAFVDLMIQNIERLPIDPGQKAKMLALMIKLKTLGPIGDQLTKILDPSEVHGDPKVALEQATGRMQQMDQMIAALTEQLNEAKSQLASKDADNQVKLQIAEMQETTKRELGIAQIDSREGLALLEQSLAKFQQDNQLNHEKLMAALQQVAAREQAQQAAGSNGGQQQAEQ